MCSFGIRARCALLAAAAAAGSAGPVSAEPGLVRDQNTNTSTSYFATPASLATSTRV